MNKRTTELSLSRLKRTNKRKRKIKINIVKNNDDGKRDGGGLNAQIALWLCFHEKPVWIFSTTIINFMRPWSLLHRCCECLTVFFYCSRCLHFVCLVTHFFYPRLWFVLYCGDIFLLVWFVTIFFWVFFCRSIVEFLFCFGYLHSAIFLGSFHSLYCMWCVLNLQYILRAFLSLSSLLWLFIVFFCDGRKKMPWWLCSILKGFFEHWTFDVCVSHAKMQLW